MINNRQLEVNTASCQFCAIITPLRSLEELLIISKFSYDSVFIGAKEADPDMHQEENRINSNNTTQLQNVHNIMG